ncbi:hypothetical protein NUSPORA_00948 [Nucleospora cyclopteri]
MKSICKEKIKKKLKEIGGNHKIAFFNLKDDRYECFLLCIEDILSTIVIVQEQGTVSYISYLDSTGFYRFTTFFLIEIIKHLQEIVVVFSFSQDEPIFGESSKNIEKKVLNNFELYNYWNFVLKETKCGKIVRWSNYKKDLEIPYKKITDIPFFDDDPKSKMCRDFNNVNDFFNGLLYRNDFDKGGLLYLIKNSNCYKNDCKLKNDDGVGEEKVSNKSSISEIICYLRNCDFSTKNTALISTKKFIESFDIKLINFHTSNIPELRYKRKTLTNPIHKHVIRKK